LTVANPHHRQSALTDFLAVHNISAAQIRDSYQQRRAQAEADAAANEEPQDEQAARDEEAEAEAAIERSRKRRKIQKDAVAKIKKGKGKGKGKKVKKDDDDDDDSDFDASLGKEMYKKAVPLPGQFENCELCSKRFTVTPYSKTGPDGGLVCTSCGKELAKDARAADTPKKKGPTGRKRRKVESDKLDGKVQMGAKSLAQLCIEKVANHSTDLEDLGDLPDGVTERLSEIFTKKRVMKPRALQLFLRADMERISIHDCACRSHSFAFAYYCSLTVRQTLRTMILSKYLPWLLASRSLSSEMRANLKTKQWPT
jgi:DNA repair protein RAD7